MSGPGAHDVSPHMESVDANLASDRFARVRDAFHRLVEVGLSRRADALEALAATDPLVAGELRALFEQLDETDLIPVPERAPPSRLGPFRLLHRIGRGGMGEVFLAERVEGGFEQRVALKLVRDSALTPELGRRFVRERQILARLQHPNIAHLVDGGVTTEGRPWLAMEYVDGERITDWCRTRQLTVEARVRLFLPICDAVQFAHRNLVVHRDLKPANLIVDGEGHPRLLDFGIARLLDADALDLTQTVAAMTPAYAAPEQRAGEPITTATDVFQLGTVLRELLHDDGRAPLRGDISRVVAKATAPLPAARYASVAMLGDDLSDWLARRPLRSGIGSRRERLRATLWLWRWPLAMLGTVVLAVGGGATLAWREAVVAEDRAIEARANLEALLGVIGSANPGRYAGREPLVGELLVDAAADLQRDFVHDPRLLRQTLSEIGHGLMNLGRAREAEPILAAALVAAQRDRSTTRSTELGLLKLLVLAQDEPSTRAAAHRSAERIAQLAGDAGPHRGLALDALASAAGALARLGDLDAARDLFALAERVDPSGASMSVSQRENFWRQRGWVALRRMDLDEAARAFVLSRTAQDAEPGQFSLLRRAELDLLRAELALAAFDPDEAAAALDAARAVIEAEYPAAHPERAHFAIQLARLDLLSGRDEAALERALAARDLLQSMTIAPGSRPLADQVARVALARARRCDEASRDTSRTSEDSPRGRAERAWMQQEIGRVCAVAD
jgi:tRNA A-37 threonylcarbamoyl transferase component Bud32/tetratricopeptide (TPR) repeat protein